MQTHQHGERGMFNENVYGGRVTYINLRWPIVLIKQFGDIAAVRRSFINIS